MKYMMERICKLTIVGAIVGFFAMALRIGRSAYADAATPLANPAQFSLKDWKQALWSVKRAFADRHLPILAAGVAYFSTLAFFPLMAATVAIAALAITPAQLESLVTTIEANLPGDVADLVATQLRTLVEQRTGNILAATIAIAVSLFGASGASKGLVTAANIAYGVRESRGWFIQQVREIGWIVAGIGFGFVVAVLLVINRSILQGVGMLSPFTEIVLYGRWILIVFLITLGLAVFYRYGPNRDRPKWQWISWGALAATIIWMAGTFFFFLYVQNFGSYDRTYSLFAGIIILMVWFNLSAFTVLLGAAVNHGLEEAARPPDAT